MALVLADRVLETTTSTGSGTITLAGAEPGYQSFSAIGNANQTYYTITIDNDWEVGIGTYTASGTTLSRDTVLASSNSGNRVTLPAGVKKVFVTYPAEKSVNLDISGNISLSSAVISGVASPSVDSDAVNKLYVDTLAAQGITYHSPVKYEVPNTTGNLVATYNNGSSGVGATLTNAGTLAAFVPDGVTASISDRVLVYNQTNAFENGVYVVSTVGNGSTSWVLTRAADADTYALKSPNSLGGGDAFYVTSGNTGAGETYLCNNSGVISFGSTAISFVQISAAQVYQAGTGISLTNTTISLVSPVAINTGGTGTTATPTNGQLLIGNGSGYTLSTLTAGSGVSITNSAGSITLSATGLGGTVTAVTATGPLASSGGTTPNISIANATGTGSVVLDQGATISSATITAGVSASITTITGSSANITTVTGTTAGFSSAAITQLSGTSAGITTVSGTTTTFSSGTITQFGATSATIATVSGTNVTYSNGNFTSASITNLALTSLTLANLSITSANVTTLTGTNLTYTSGTVTNLNSTSANITTLTGTTFGTTATTQIRGASADITTLTGSSMNVTTATHASANITTIAGTTATYTSATVTNLALTSLTLANLSITSANVTTLTGTNLTYTSGTITNLNSTSANITTLTGTNFTASSLNVSNSIGLTSTGAPGITKTYSARVDVSAGGLGNPFWQGWHFATPDTIVVSGGNTFPRTSFYNTYSTATNPTDLAFAIMPGNNGAGNYALILGANAAEQVRVTATGVGIKKTAATALDVSGTITGTAVSATDGSFTSATVTNLNSTSANITTLTGTTFGTTATTQLRGASGAITTLTGTTLNYASATLGNLWASATISAGTTSTTGRINANEKGFTPSNTDVTKAAIVTSGSYGGGLVMNDGGIGAIWMQSAGTEMGIGVGTTSGVGNAITVRNGGATIGSLTVTTLTGTSANITTLTATSSNITTLTGTNLTYTSGTITNLAATSLTLTRVSTFQINKQNTTGEGGEFYLEKSDTSTLAGNLVIDLIGNSLRFFENGGTARGTTLDISAQAAGASSVLLTSSNYTSYVGNGTLTMNVSGTGLSGSQTFTANQSGNATFTVTSNATSANTGSTIVARDGSGNFSAGTITATLSGNASTATTATNQSGGTVSATSVTSTGQLLINYNITSPPANYYNGLQQEIRATSGVAGIGLHRSGFSHCGIYHDTSNQLGFNFNSGTVTMPHNAGTLMGSGNYTTYALPIKTVSDWSTAPSVIGNVIGMLAWKNYGNNHVIFDASAGTAPNGTAVNNTNSQGVWTASYPTLMGWNGANTYGVRVDSARISDSTSGSAATFTSTSQNSQFNSVGVGTAGSGTAGEIRATNNVTAYYSDARLKDFKGKIGGALDKVSQLNGYYYTENVKAEEFGYNNKAMQVGVSAQEVQAVLPEIVTAAPFDIAKDEDGNEISKSGENYMTVRYERLVPLLIEAIKELKAEVEALKANKS